MLELPTVVPYFDLSLQHASAPLLRSMKRWGSGDRFLDLDRVASAPTSPTAAFRSSFIVGFPGETEADHDELLGFLRDGAARLGRLLPVLGRGRHARPRRSTAQIAAELAAERLRECSEVQDPITQAARDALVGETVEVLVDGVDPDTGDARRAHAPRGARDRRRRADHRRRRSPARARSSPRSVTAADGPDLIAAAAVAPRSARARRHRELAGGADEAVRAGRGRDAGELHHDRPPAVRDPDAASSSSDEGATWLTVSLWFVLSCTDGVDGWVARRDGTTRSGAFLDPLADKVLTIGGFVALRRRAATSGGCRSR